MRYFAIKKLAINTNGGVYFKYTKDGTDGMRRSDHVFCSDIVEAFRFEDFDTAQLHADHLSVVMSSEFGIVSLEL